MTKLEARLSKRILKETGRSEVLIRFYDGKKWDLYAGSEIYVTPEHFAYLIDTKACARLNIKVPKLGMATLPESVKYGYPLKMKEGDIIVKERIETEDVRYHREQQQRLNDLKQYILKTYEECDKDSIKGDWLDNVIDRFNHPEKFKVKVKSFFELFNEYLDKKQFCYDYDKGMRVLMRILARWDAFRRTEMNKPKISINTLTKDDIDDFREYLRDEYQLSKEYPKLFEKIMNDYPVELHAVHKSPKLVQRGENANIKLMKKFKAFIVWCYDKGKTTNRPFESIKIGTETYGTPYYITLEERNHIADFDLSTTPALEVQRDIFIFQCLIGCRVSDLLRLTERNIVDGEINYIPTKTREEKPTTVKVPLNERARLLVKKYKGKDKQGRLFPFISAQKYNEDIKEIFTRCGVNRIVVVRNPTTGEEEQRPLNEIASSHLARRTFIGNIYRQVPDPNLIAPMSGHSYGSRAFARYRDVDKDMRKKLVNLID